ncbi:MAG: hypothetical protein OEZ09_12410, partial [Betaproteobacteria bacterium]|nr:hypothetical protein [Betaproteobacteria bacterium]
MAAKRKSEDADLVTRIARAARGSQTGPQAELAERFVQLYYAGTDLQELAARAPGDLTGAALSHLEFGHRHAGSAATVRV